MDIEYLNIVIIMLMMWVFGNKILPQTILMFVSLSMLVGYIQSAHPINVGIALIYAVTVLYAVLQMTNKEDSNGL
jgi:hypothetical protein